MLYSFSFNHENENLEGQMEMPLPEGGEEFSYAKIESDFEPAKAVAELINKGSVACYQACNYIAARAGTDGLPELAERELRRKAMVALDDFESYFCHVLAKAYGEKTISEAFIEELLKEE